MGARLDNALEPMKSELKRQNRTVAKIEVGHVKKISAPYDAHIDTVRNATTIQDIDSKVEDRDNCIFALEQTVSNK